MTKKKVHAHWAVRKGRFRTINMKGLKFRRAKSAR